MVKHALSGLVEICKAASKIACVMRLFLHGKERILKTLDVLVRRNQYLKYRDISIKNIRALLADNIIKRDKKLPTVNAAPERTWASAKQVMNSEMVKEAAD